jgi:hypothetical protein
MANYTIFNLENIENLTDNINIDDLFEKKKEHNIREFNLFKKILNRIHIKIKITSRQKLNEQFIWFVVPEFIIGYPKYDISTCIIFLLDNLKKNNFLVKYYHPNTLYIYWGHYFPSYMRNEIKNKFGIKLNELGMKIPENDDTHLIHDIPQQSQSKSQQQTLKKEINKKYTDIKTYNPTGNLFYNEYLNSSSSPFQKPS